jgi:hypothetical protein
MFKIEFINGLYELAFYSNPNKDNEGEFIGYFKTRREATEAGYATMQYYKDKAEGKLISQNEIRIF